MRVRTRRFLETERASFRSLLHVGRRDVHSKRPQGWLIETRRTGRLPKPEFDLGDKLREQFGEVRYVSRIVHNGDQWTVEASWERLVGDQWVPFDLPVQNY